LKAKYILLLFLILVLPLFSYDMMMNNSVDYFNQQAFKPEIINPNAGIFRFSGTYYELGVISGRAGIELGITLSYVKQYERDFYIEQTLLFERVYPGIIEYRKGIAHAYGYDYEQNKYNIKFNVMSLNVNWFGCSSFSVSSEITEDGHVYYARNFDFMEHQYNFQLYDIEGAYRIIGHSFGFGYPLIIDGMNEKGLALSMNLIAESVHFAFELGPLPEKAGLEANYFMRLVLETCATIDEVLELLSTVPIFPSGPNVHIQITEPSGKSILIEFLRNENNKLVIVDTQKPYLVSTNFVVSQNGYRGNNGYLEGPCLRYKALTDALENVEGLMSKEQVGAVIESVILKKGSPLSQDFGFETIVSALFDLTEKRVEYRLKEDNFQEVYVFDFSTGGGW
jgi:predicted choloylglycine hydrolase